MTRIFVAARVFSSLIATIMLFSFLNSVATAQETPQSIYDFKMNSLEGKPVDLAQYKGKYMLVVNTASKCGYTPQYGELEKLHEQFGEKVAVLGFPANDFLWQEPGSNKEIATFCEKYYGVKFQMFEKISVKGKKVAPLFTWLEKATGKKPTWNFCKYLIDREGKVIGFFNSKVSPLDNQIVGALK